MHKCKVYITFAIINQYIYIMKTNYLLPPSYKTPGMVLSLLFACGCLYVLFSEQNDLFGELLYKMGINNAFDEICIIGLSASLLLTAFSCEKDEDECIAHTYASLDACHCRQLPDTDSRHTQPLQFGVSLVRIHQHVYDTRAFSVYLPMETLSFQKGQP